MESRIDACGRILVGREDSNRLAAQWVQDHGQPRHSGDLIQRDQWIAREVAKEIATRG